MKGIAWEDVFAADINVNCTRKKNAPNGGRVSRIVTHTSSEHAHAKMDEDGAIRVEICFGLLCCTTTSLDNVDKNDFEVGATDDFMSFGGCDDWRMSEFVLSSLTVSAIHEGPDAWLGDALEVYFGDDDYIVCEMNGWIDNDEKRVLECRCGYTEKCVDGKE